MKWWKLKIDTILEVQVATTTLAPQNSTNSSIPSSLQTVLYTSKQTASTSHHIFNNVAIENSMEQNKIQKIIVNNVQWIRK